jgi:hypothetical protein
MFSVRDKVRSLDGQYFGTVVSTVMETRFDGDQEQVCTVVTYTESLPFHRGPTKRFLASQLTLHTEE